MVYVKVENGIVVQKQNYQEGGFISAPNSTIIGAAFDGTDFTNPTPIVKTPMPDWEKQRRSTMVDGGYGTYAEQLELLGEQGIEAYLAHIADVKARIPKI